MTYMGYDKGTDEREVIAAHVYRDQEILCTVLIEPTSDNQWRAHVTNPLGGFDVTEGSLQEAIDRADAYLAGYEAGYNYVQGEAHAEEQSKHQRPITKERKANRDQRYRGRITTFSRERGDRANDPGTGEGQRSD
jgi:hypothetical protein